MKLSFINLKTIVKFFAYSAISIVSLASTFSFGAANAPSTASRQQCDELAAKQHNPDNPKNIISVDIADIDSEKAIAACMQAIAENPKVYRFKFQLARSYASNYDFKNALKLYHSLALRGYAPAQSNLGSMYATGRGVKQSYEKALDLYRKAAEQGYAVAQNNLGNMYDYGDGVEESDEEAAKWYLKSADQDHVLGQYNLGEMYEYGMGVPQSDSEAKKWYQKAADQGDQNAIEKLQEMPPLYF